jgi:transcriptional regulator with XRE-family HTH domain
MANDTHPTQHADYVALGQTIRTQRERLHFPKSEASRRSGISVTTWRAVEEAKHKNVTNDTLRKMAEALDLPVNKLLTMIGRGPVEDLLDAWEPSYYWEVKIEPLQGTWVTVAGGNEKDVARIVDLLRALHIDGEVSQ